MAARRERNFLVVADVMEINIGPDRNRRDAGRGALGFRQFDSLLEIPVRIRFVR